MHASFTPAGDWFVFDAASGRTLQRGFRSKGQAQRWIARAQAGGAGADGRLAGRPRQR